MENSQSATVAAAVCHLFHMSEDPCACVNIGEIAAESEKTQFAAAQELKYISKHKKWSKHCTEWLKEIICQNMMVFMHKDAVVPCARGYALINSFKGMPSPRKAQRDRELYGR